MRPRQPKRADGAHGKTSKRHTPDDFVPSRMAARDRPPQLHMHQHEHDGVEGQVRLQQGGAQLGSVQKAIMKSSAP
jgi:hypothetical protein